MENSEKLGIASVVVLAIVVAWYWGLFDGSQYSDDPQVAELERLRDENVGKIEQLPEEERRAQHDAFRQRMGQLSESQRMALMESSMPIFIPMAARQFEQRYDKFMAMSPEEQRKELDKRIDEMEARGGQGGGGGQGRGGPPNMDSKKMDELRKKMLAYTTPEQRAKFENGIRMLNERREERGLSPIKRPFF